LKFITILTKPETNMDQLDILIEYGTLNLKNAADNGIIIPPPDNPPQFTTNSMNMMKYIPIYSN